MCGVIGIYKKIKDKSVVSEVLQGLINLEYRGYDSSGIATFDENGKIEIEKNIDAPSSLKNAKILRLESNVAIGHNRWATHGKISVQNAHPHGRKELALVHNGTINNFNKLKTLLKTKGHIFYGESDTEVIATQVLDDLSGCVSNFDAFKKTISILDGTFALCTIFLNDENSVYFAKHKSPLLIGRSSDRDNYCVVSDVTAFPFWADEVCVLDDGDRGFVSDGKLFLYNVDNFEKAPVFHFFKNEKEIISIGEYKTFMLKEIAEQPIVNAGIVNFYIDHKTLDIDLGVNIDLQGIEEIHIVACGTSYYSGLVASGYFEKYSRVKVFNYIASEVPYKNGIELFDRKKSLFVFISQSGETLDTINAINYIQDLEFKTLGIVNAKHTTITRLIKDIIYCRAGVEVSVASTKAFTAQLIILIIFALYLGIKRNSISKEEYMEKVKELFDLGRLMSEVLDLMSICSNIAESILDVGGFMYLARGICFGVALEGALKMKEISYIHAEGINAGEMKHGSIALIDEDEAVVIIIHSKDPLFSKTRSTVQEVIARKGRVILVADKFAIDKIAEEVDDKDVVLHSIEIPNSSFFLYPFISVVPLQFLAHFVASGLGNNVDRPRNLAKSVTVE